MVEDYPEFVDGDNLEPVVTQDGGQFGMVPLAFVEARGLSDRAHRLYVLMAAKWAHRSTRECFPSRQAMAVLLECSLNSLDRAMKELVDGGWVTVRPRFVVDGSDGTRRQTSNSYHLSTGLSTPPSPVVQPPLPTLGDPPLPTGGEPRTRISKNQKGIPAPVSQDPDVRSLTGHYVDGFVARWGRKPPDQWVKTIAQQLKRAATKDHVPEPLLRRAVNALVNGRSNPANLNHVILDLECEDLPI